MRLKPTTPTAMPTPSISIIIPNYNETETLAACVDSVLAKTQYPDWELIVVDDGSTDDSLSKIKDKTGVRVIRRSHQGVAAALNTGFTAAGTRDVVRLHADVVIETPDWLTKLVEAAYTQPRAGIVGVKLVYPDGRIQAEGRNIINGLGFHIRHRNRKAFAPEGGPGKIAEVDSVPGALAYYRRDVISAVGGLDENYGHVWTEDDDFCVAARFHGYKIYVETSVAAVHYTRCWGPASFVRLAGTEKSLRQLTWVAKHQVEHTQAIYWEAKWGWNPFYPDLNEIRRLYGHTEICWQIGEPMCYRPQSEFPTVDCCIVTANSVALLKRCLESLAATDYPLDRFRVFIADNGSTDGTIDYLDKLAATFPLPISVSKLPLNSGVPVGLNWALMQGKGELVARLDDDIVLPPNWLKPMVEDFRRRPFAGCVGPKVLNDNARGDIQCGAWRHFPGLFGHEDETDLGQANYLARTIHVRGCCNLYRRDVFARCGMMDLRYSPSQFDDPDHHIALVAAGYEILYDGRVSIVHKLNNGLARSYAALTNQSGNGSKMYGKWGGDIFEVLEKAIDLSREGRYLPDDGDTTNAYADAPDPKLFPRRNAHPPGEVQLLVAKINKELSSTACREALQSLADDYLALGNSQRRDGFPRAALDTLNSALHFMPHHVGVIEATAATYKESGQLAMARLLARRGLQLDPDHNGLRALLTALDQPAIFKTGAVRSADRSDHIGEVGVSVANRFHAAAPSRRLRVLMVNSFESRAAGGDMNQLKKTKQYLEMLGVEVDVCCTPRPDPRNYDLVHVFNLWFPHQTLAQLKAIRLLAPQVPVVLSPIYWDASEKAWADAAVPHVFATSTSPEDLEKRLALLATDKLAVNGLRRSQAGEPNYFGYHQYQRQLLEMVDHLLPLSLAEVANLRKTLGVEKPYNLVHNGAEISVFESAKPDWFIEEYKMRNFVLTVGLVEPRKNQLMLLHALRQEKIPVVVVGRNYDINYLRLCRKFAPPNTLFIEHLPHEQLASAFKAARVHALPSWMECAALANVEAALCGCPLVVSDRTSEPEYFGKNAYYCDPANVTSIRKAVLSAWRNYKADAPKREKLREQFLTEYTWPKAAEQTLRGYEAALAARKNADARKRSVSISSAPAASAVVSVSTSEAKMKKTIAPEVSIVIPTFNRLDLTRACLKALHANTPTEDFELIVVDNASTDGTREFVAAEQTAGRLTAILNEKNAGFARACNQGAAAARGKYVLFLNNDTEVRPGWLSPLIQSAEADPQIGALGGKLLYSDNTIQHAGVVLLDDRAHGDPLLAQHIFSRQPHDLPEANRPKICPALTAACLFVRREIFEQVGGFDEEFWNGYEDVDLCLKISAAGKRLVYQPASVVTHHESQSGPERFRRAPQNIARLHQKWLGKVQPDFIIHEDGRVNPTGVGRFTDYPPAKPGEEKKSRVVSIIILAFNQLEHTRACLESLAARTTVPHEIIVVDNCSTDGTPEFLKSWQAAHENCTVIRNESNRGFAGGNNQGLSIARGDFLVLLNNDTIVTHGWLEHLLEAFDRHPDTGIAGPVSNNVSGPQLVKAAYGNLQEMPGFAEAWTRNHRGQSLEVTRAVGFCLAARREVISAIGGLDERFGSGNFEDDDFCIRARLAGFHIRIAQDAFVHHTGSQTFKGAKIDYRQAMLRNWDLFRAKWQMGADVSLEKGYPVPMTLPAGIKINVPLPRLELTHKAADKRCWTQSNMQSATPTAPPALARLGNLDEARSQFGRHEFESAWKSVIAALRVRPFHPEAFLLLAEIALAAGDGKSAKLCAQRARAIAPNWKAAKQFLNKSLKGGAKLDWLKLPGEVQSPKSKVQSLSVCLIVKNEEQFLAQCLKSVRGFAAQIVVVDTGSTDRTVEIAREFGAEIYSFAWCDDFAAARNAALEHATGDWILMLDADEELPADQHARLVADLKRADVIAHRLPLAGCGQEAEGRYFVPRLFRNAPGVFYYSRIHEQVFPSLVKCGMAWELKTAIGTAQLLHHGYAKEIVRDRNKIERNLRLLRQAVEEYPNDPNLAMNLGLELVRSGNLPAGLAHYREAFQLMSAQPPAGIVPELREVLLTQLTCHLHKARAHDEIVQTLNSTLAKRGGLTASLHFALGLAHFELKQYREAAEQMRQCLARRKQTALSPINPDILTVVPSHCLALSLAKLGDLPAAEKAFAAALTETGHVEAAKLDYAKFLASGNRPVEALNQLHEMVKSNAQHAGVWRLGGEIALSRPEFLEFARDWTAEAIRQLPDDGIIVAQRAEVLLLSQELASALPLWSRAVNGERPPRAVAAQILCATAASQPVAGLCGQAEEPVVSRAFVDWYRRLVMAGAHDAIVGLNSRVETLRPILPAAAGVLDGVIAATQSK